MDKTIFVLLDACQYEAGTKNLGYLEHLIDYRQGAKYKVRGELPSLSKPMYATLLTGLPVYRHGVTYNEILKNLDCDSVFSLCKAYGGVTAAAAYGWMSELYNHIPFHPVRDRIQIQSGEHIDYGIFYWEDMYPDSHLFADGEYLRNNYHPDFILYHSMGIDEQGHLSGAGSAAYEKAVMAAGILLSSLMPEWLAAGYNVVVTGDHGMNELGIHGGTEDSQRDTPLYIFSDKVKKGRFEETSVSQLNVAPLLCRLLDIPAAEGMQSSLEIRLADGD